MSLVWLCVFYCALIALASLGGGWIPIFIKLTHRRMQVSLSFVAGVMLGVGLLHMLPHGYEALGDIDTTVLWMMGGFLLLFFFKALFHFHHHDAPDDDTPQAVCDHPEHDHSHDRGHVQEKIHGHEHAHGRAGEGKFSWGGAALGMTLHGLVDGIALAAAIQAERHGSTAAALAGMGTFLAVFLHKPFDSLTIGTLMSASGWSARARHAVNLLYALVTPLGVALFFWGTDLGQFQNVVGYALAFSAGAFLCIATSDLLPELQFHHHDRGKLSLALLLGIALAWSIGFLETSGHEHHHHGAAAIEHESSEHGHATHEH